MNNSYVRYLESGLPSAKRLREETGQDIEVLATLLEKCVKDSIYEEIPHCFNESILDVYAPIFPDWYNRLTIPEQVKLYQTDEVKRWDDQLGERLQLTQTIFEDLQAFED